MTEAEVIQGILQPGRFDALVASADEARRLLRQALPGAIELPQAIAGQPYPAPPAGIRQWFQVHPPEPHVGIDLPHVKYFDWSKGKKGKGGSWGHLFFPPETS